MMVEPKIGMKLYGYCGGGFGRDSYSNKRIEFIGYDYIVARNEDGDPEFLCTYENEPIMIDTDWLEEKEGY